MKDLIFILMFSPMLILTIRNPFLGLCAWGWTIMAVPKNMLWGFASDIRYTFLLAILTIIAMAFNKDIFRRPPISSIFVIMVLFLCQTGLANISSMGNSDASWAVWSDFFKAIVFSGLIITLLTTKNRINTFVIALLLGIGFNVLFEGLKFVVTGGAYQIVGIKNSMMTDNNLFALAVLMLIPLFLYIIPQVKQKYIKLGFTALAGLSAVCVIGSYSRGGFIGLLVVASQVFMKTKRKIIFILFAASFASVAIYIAADKWSDRIQTIEHAEEDKSFLGRLTSWKLATLAAIDNPILGIGQDSMQYYHVWNYYYDDITDFDFISEVNTSRETPKAAHSIYFQVLGDSGFLGLGLFLLILSKGFFLSRSLAKKAHEDWIKDLAKAINTTIIVYMIAGALLSLAYYDLIYGLIALLVCLQRINGKTKENEYS
jgi:probable O-glycosylation ligase (exosortase A-associated)